MKTTTSKKLSEIVNEKNERSSTDKRSARAGLKIFFLLGGVTMKW